MKNKSYLLKTILIAVVVLASYAVTSLWVQSLQAAARDGSHAAAEKRSPEAISPGQLELVGRLVIKALDNAHLRKLDQNSMLSSRVFDEYFKLLDPGKVYFTRQDIAMFGKDRFRLFDELNNGEQRVIYAIYQRYLERIRQYREFVENEIKKGVDFTGSDSYCTDRKEAAYCRDDAELFKLWQKRLKNDLLYYRLMQKVMEERSDDPEIKAELKKRWFTKSPEDKVRIRLHDLYNFAEQSDQMDILGMFLTALAQVYGPHSHYSTPKQMEDFDIQFKLSLIGIGATLTSEDGYVKVVELVPGGPADKDGRLQPEDRIIAVAQEGGEPVDVIDMSVTNVVKMVRGKDGTKVTLTVLPAAKGSSALPEDITITRRKVELKENAAQGEVKTVVDSSGKKRKIGVIKLNNFYMDFEGASRGLPNYRSCSRDVQAILQDFRASGVDGVVLDLRSNSGGSLLEAIKLSGLFITSGPIVQVVDAGKNLEVHEDQDPRIAYTGPLVVLVSKFSASSSEILTGAMKDYQRAVIVGDSRTYGKGTVLSVTDLSRLLRFFNRRIKAGSLTHEIAMFYRINGESNQARGIKPDIVLPSFTETMEIGEQYSDNHLPWNAIAPLKLADESRQKYVPVAPELLRQLQQQSMQRFKELADLKILQQDIARFKSIRDRKEVSLNEKQRLKEYYDEKAAADRMEEMMDGQDSKNKKKKQRDLLLREAVNIAAETARLQNQK